MSADLPTPIVRTSGGLKKAPNHREIGTSNRDISKIYVKWKQQQQIICFRVFLTLLVLLTLLYSFAAFLCTDRTGSSHFEICVRRLKLFQRDQSAPIFHSNEASVWTDYYVSHCTQVSLKLVLTVISTDFSIFRQTFRNCLSVSRFSDSLWDLETKRVGIPDCETHGKTVRVGRSVSAAYI